MTEAGEADPPAQGSRLPWYQSTVLVGEDLGDFLPQIPGTQKGKSGEAPSAAGLSRHAGLWELFWGRITGRASALGQELQPHTLPHSAGSHQHSSNPLVHRLFNSPSPLTAAGPVHSRLIPAPTDTHPMQEERRTGVLPTPAALRASCIQGTPAPPPFLWRMGWEGRCRVKHFPHLFPSQGSLSTCCWALGQKQETTGPSCFGSASCLP